MGADRPVDLLRPALSASVPRAGEHPGGHATHGHSLVVDPAGRVVADSGGSEGVAIAVLDLARVAAARTSIPSYSLDAKFALRHAGIPMETQT